MFESFFTYWWWWFGYFSLLTLFSWGNLLFLNGIVRPHLYLEPAVFVWKKYLMLIVYLLWQKIRMFFSFISPWIFRLFQRAVFPDNTPTVTTICSKALLGYRTLKKLVPLLLFVGSWKFTWWETCKLSLEIHLTMTGIFVFTAGNIHSTAGICDRHNNAY